MYYGLFQCERDVLKEFGIGEVDGNIIFAAYEYEDYSGSAEVVFISNGKFWHVSGSHCSCHGLENQWEPEEMPYEALMHMVENASYGMLSSMSQDLREAIDGARSRVGVNADTPPELAEVALRIAYR